MTDFLLNYGLFLLKTLTLLVGVFLTFLAVFAASINREKLKPRLSIKNVNHYFLDLKNQLHREILDKKAFKNKLKDEKEKKKSQKSQKNSIATSRRKIFVLHFEGDIKASSVKNLREEITAILTVGTPKDEVLLKINSAGGTVHGYGLAAAQLQRIKAKHMQLTIAIDKVAASGGYMMACVGSTLLAAPFAIIGSIGVMAQLPNFYRYLDKHHIDMELLTAGKFKRTLTVFGKNTEEARKKAQEDIDGVHVLFKEFIRQNRPLVDVEDVSTGEYWHAIQAIEKQLVDRLITSDDYLLDASETADIYEISYQIKKGWAEKISSTVHLCLEKVITALLELNHASQ